MAVYAIAVSEKNYDLIEFCRQGDKPKISKSPTTEAYWFVFDTNPENNRIPEIKTEEEMYDESGHTKELGIHWIL